jgi:hypothetical protein
MVQARAVLTAEAGGAVRHEPDALCGTDLRAEVRALATGRKAEDAAGVAALRGVAWDDLVSRLHTRNTCANALNLTPCLVSQNAGKFAFGIAAFQGVDIGVAKSIRVDLPERNGTTIPVLFVCLVEKRKQTTASSQDSARGKRQKQGT